MKRLALLVTLQLCGCGYSSQHNEITGQVKKVVMHTPLICPDYATVDISLGVMRNGQGSMSGEDMWIYVPKDDLLTTLKQANENGDIIKGTYSTKRVTWCVPERALENVAILK